MSSFGSNLGFVDELYSQFRTDPESVSEAWRDFFADYQPAAIEPHSQGAGERQVGTAAVTSPAVGGDVTASQDATRSTQPPADAVALIGAAGRLSSRMVESLAVPTATSARHIGVKLLEENRRILNQHQTANSRPKISFTHVIAWAVVRALQRHPELNAQYLEWEGKPFRAARSRICLGLAIDLEKRGERSLVVPNIKDAGSLDFPSFLGVYTDLVGRARLGKLGVDELQGTTVTLTNPGMLGTGMSVPRLMPDQGAIIGIGTIGYPAEYTGMAAHTIAELGLSKVMTVTSTYDHRIIQGASSGAFLATLERLITGHDRFYEGLFEEMGVPHEPMTYEAEVSTPAPSLGLFEGAGAGGALEAIEKQAQVLQLIRTYRVRGHLWAHTDPLGSHPAADKELELSFYGLSVWDLDRRFVAGDLAAKKRVLPLREILDTLRDTYCRHIGVEFMHLTHPVVRSWLYEMMESTRNSEPLPTDTQLRVLGKLNDAEALERFLHTTYLGHKRFSLEGAEALIPMLDAVLNEAGDAEDDAVETVVIGMAHRGRLNVLCNVVGKSYGDIFRQFEGELDPASAHGSGDVKYHMGASGTHRTPGGREVKVQVASNPSHLEAVDPVVEGMARAEQERVGDSSKVLPLLIHGDAAFAGQGVVAETLNLSELRGYHTGGTLHIVVNNQIGFTTAPEDARSSLYATDIAKMVRAPIFHVNGDHPDDVLRVVRLAVAFRQRFHRDVVIDLMCYRRWGHNETDDPSYTHPLLYSRIQKQRSVRKIYTERLLRRGDIDPEQAEQALEQYRAELKRVHDEVPKAQERKRAPEPPKALEEGLQAQTSEDREGLHTGVPRDRLLSVLEGLDRFPDDFTAHPKLEKQLSRRRQRFDDGQIDWALAEALAFGSLVLEGRPVRLSGQDSGRGTFSQRHAVLHDYNDGHSFIPLAHLAADQATFSVYDSHLSEFAVLGFEYGYSVKSPNSLVLWEAQFGDFCNGAQVIIDQFIASAEDKWGQRSAITLLLPHGYEGQGPEHSSGRIERFLQLCARDNLRVTVPSTPAQCFHLLRRQALHPDKKPLVVFTPKSMLRSPAAVSKPEELTTGTFAAILGDDLTEDAERVQRVLLCSGKVFYDLDAYRRQHNDGRTAIVRVEQLYPLLQAELTSAVGRYPQAREVVWVQEEPRNMGAFTWAAERLRACLPAGVTLGYAGRSSRPSPATGSSRRHVEEQEQLVREAFAA